MRVFFESRNGVKGEFVVSRDLNGRAWDDHRSEGFVAAEEILGDLFGDGDQVGFEVVGVLDYEGGRDNVGK